MSKKMQKVTPAIAWDDQHAKIACENFHWNKQPYEMT